MLGEPLLPWTCLVRLVFACALQENVLLDSQGHVKVTDFGLAKDNMSDDVRTNSFIGTMECASLSCRLQQDDSQMVVSISRLF